MPDFFDIHSHVTFKDYEDDLEEVLSRMKGENVWTTTVGVDEETSQEAVEFAKTHEGFFATIGLHPTDTPHESFNESYYEELVNDPKVLAIGECGLDYFRMVGDPAVEKPRQRVEFEKQMAFAITHNKPLMIHCRPSKGSMDAYEDILLILESEHKRVGDKLRGNVHFFVGDVGVAKRFYDIGFTTSFTGVLTFTNDYNEVVKSAPLSMILTETDSPFATPTPFRGKRNEPQYVRYVVEAIARIRGEEEGVVRQAVVQNAFRVFGLTA